MAQNRRARSWTRGAHDLGAPRADAACWVPPAPAPAAHTLAANAPVRRGRAPGGGVGDAARRRARAGRGGADGADLAGAGAGAVRDADGVERGGAVRGAGGGSSGPRRLDRDAGAARRDAAARASIDLTAEESPALECVPRKVARASTGSRVTDRKALEERMAADGWTKEEKQREGSATVDKYWIDPNGGKKCRSFIEVARRAYPQFVQEAADAPKRTAKKSLEDLIGEGSSRRAPSSSPGR